MISANHLAYLESVAAVLLDETKRMKGEEKRQYRRAYVECRRKLDALKAEAGQDHGPQASKYN